MSCDGAKVGGRRISSLSGYGGVEKPTQPCGGATAGHRDECHQAQLRMVGGRQYVLFHVKVADIWMSEMAHPGAQCPDAEAIPGGTERLAGLLKPADDVGRASCRERV